MTNTELVEEIALLMGEPKETVRSKFADEMASIRTNVCREAKLFGITPHHFDDRMAALYREGEGFIYETLVFWQRPFRQQWIKLAADRIRRLPTTRPRVLMLSDGAGSDSLYLSSCGFDVTYCDFPGSRIFEFATRRFAHHGADIHIVSDRNDLVPESFDAVLSFEVLEHLTDPGSELKAIASYLRPNGIALITESFAIVTPDLPTHLTSNLRFVGRLPFLCASAGLRYGWSSYDLKPVEFVKRPVGRLPLVCNPRIWKLMLYHRCPYLWNIPYRVKTRLLGNGRVIEEFRVPSGNDGERRRMK